MPKVLEDYPLPLFVDAFRTNLRAVLGVFLAAYLAAALTCFVAWQWPSPAIWFLLPLVFACSWDFFHTSIWWIPGLLLPGMLGAYILLKPLRVEILLLITLTSLYLNTFGRWPELPGPFLARLIIVTAGMVILGIASCLALPWKYRQWVE
jgi:hypothetical protein